MSEAEVVRQRIRIGARSRRSLEERLGLRFPRLLSLSTRAIARLSPRSRLRQALLRRSIRAGCEALNRGDYEAAMMLYHAEVESTFPAGMSTVAESETHGRDERLRFQARWGEDWGTWRIEPEDLIDFGDRVLMLGRVESSGLRSGAAADTECAFLFTHSAGRAIREQVFLSQKEGLEAAGLSE